MNNTYYAYLHTRLDKNEIFYVGIGKKSLRYKTNCKSSYSRAYTKQGRNIYWLNITNKTAYNIQIVFECNDLNEIKRKEIELISIYGRKDLKKGTLVNLTDGGDGLNHSENRNKILSILHKTRPRRPLTENEKLNIANQLKKYYSLPENKIKRSNNAKKYYENNVSLLKDKPRPDWVRKKISIANTHLKKPVLQYDKNMNYINEYPSTCEAEKQTGCRKDTIRNCANNKSKSAKNFIWKWKI